MFLKKVGVVMIAISLLLAVGWFFGSLVLAFIHYILIGDIGLSFLLGVIIVFLAGLGLVAVGDIVG